MAWTNLALVTNVLGKSPYQVRVSCEGPDPALIQEILEAIEEHLDNCWGNYTGEEYAALHKAHEDRPVDMDSVG